MGQQSPTGGIPQGESRRRFVQNWKPPPIDFDRGCQENNTDSSTQEIKGIKRRQKDADNNQGFGRLWFPHYERMVQAGV
jgi:hypothetical protein